MELEENQIGTISNSPNLTLIKLAYKSLIQKINIYKGNIRAQLNNINNVRDDSDKKQYISDLIFCLTKYLQLISSLKIIKGNIILMEENGPKNFKNYTEKIIQDSAIDNIISSEEKDDDQKERYINIISSKLKGDNNINTNSKYYKIIKFILSNRYEYSQ